MDDLDAILDELNRLVRVSEMPRRVALCRQALTLVSKDDDSELWAALQVKLGTSLAQMRTGLRAENLEQAAAAYREALTIRTRQAMPVAWAETMLNLGSVYAQLPVDRANHLEAAIDAYEQALEVLTEHSQPAEWALTLNNIANAYMERVHGSRAENIERAIGAYQQALRVRTRETLPAVWAETTQGLASAYRHRMRGEPGANIEQALRLYQQVLAVRTRAAMPGAWAEIQNHLAIVYTSHFRGSRADNLEAAIAACEQALEIRTRAAMPIEWAETTNNLAVVYSQRVVGDRAENLERAIALYEQVLEVRIRAAMPIEWAMTTLNLANVLFERVLGDRDENTEQAIAEYEQALQVLQPQTSPAQWAMAVNNLGTAYTDRISGDRAENLERAIALYEQALEVRTRAVMPVEWATTTNNLAAAYRQRQKGDRAENLERAIALYEQALAVRTRAAMPIEWAATTHRLATTYRQSLRGSSADNLDKSISLYRQALEVRTIEVAPGAHRQTQRNLGNLLFGQQRWDAAYAAYAAAVVANDLLYQASATPTARQAELEETSDLPSNAAYCLAQLQRLDEAVTLLERSKARALSEALARDDALLQQAQPEDRQAFDTVREQITRLEAEARAVGQIGSRDFVTISADLHTARTLLTSVVARIRAYLPDFAPDSLSIADIGEAAALTQQPLVYLLTTQHGSLALIMIPDASVPSAVHVVWLTDFTREHLDALLYDSEHQRRYLFAVVSGDPQLLPQVLDACWPVLGPALMTPLNDWLHAHGYVRATLIPVGNLSLLPLHALNTAQIHYALAPSARALRRVHAAAAQRTTPAAMLLGIGDPDSNRYPLPFAQFEVDEIAPFFPEQGRHTFYGGGATLANIQMMLASATHLHFACHGTFDIVEPLDSALMLAGQDTLSLRMLLNSSLDLDTARLAVLSACQSGIIDFRYVPDEAIGLPAGFLQAGVPGVVSTLWPVVDPSTALLLVRFYGLHLEQGHDPADALAQAQEWLRTTTAQNLGLADVWKRQYQASGRQDVKALRWTRYYQANPNIYPFAHPYYWAAFYFSGVGVRPAPRPVEA